MVNREQRAEARELILQFMAGEITNDDFGDAFPAKTEDAALRAIDQMLWFWYDDLKTHRLTGKHELLPEEKEMGERCALFLATDLEYECLTLATTVYSIRSLLSLVASGLGEGGSSRRRSWETTRFGRFLGS